MAARIDMAVTGGTVVLPEGPARVSVLVRDGRIAGIADGVSHPAAETIIDARGKVVLPGVIDMHVHFRDPGLTHKEDFATGTLQAACGGVTTICDMPNTYPPVVSAAALAEKLAAVGPKAHVDFGFWAGGARVEEYPALAAAGCVGIKAYLTISHVKGAAYMPELFVADDGQLVEIFEGAARAGLLVAVHVDNVAIARRARERLQAAGRRDPMAHYESLQTLATLEGTSKIIILAEKLGVRLHIAHATLTSLDAVRHAERRRREGAPVTLEAGPPAVSLEDLRRLGPYALPFELSAEEQEQYWRWLADGTIDAVATDHAPHTREEKERGREDIFAAPTGFPAVETLLPLMFTEVMRGRFDLARLAALCAANPARILGLPRKGRIAVGCDADLVIVDPERRERLRADRLHAKVGWTPFEGREVQGLPETTMLRGTVISEKGEPVGKPGYGQMVHPTRPVNPALSPAAPASGAGPTDGDRPPWN